MERAIDVALFLAGITVGGCVLAVAVSMTYATCLYLLNSP